MYSRLQREQGRNDSISDRAQKRPEPAQRRADAPTGHAPTGYAPTGYAPAGYTLNSAWRSAGRNEPTSSEFPTEIKAHDVQEQSSAPKALAAQERLRPVGPRDSSPEVAPPQPATAASLPLQPTIDPYAVWRQLQSEFALQQPAASVDSVIQDSWVIAYEDGHFIVGIADAFRYDWVVKKLRTQIKRKLAVIVGRASVDVEFRVQPRPTVDLPGARPTPLYDGQPAAPAPAPGPAERRQSLSVPREQIPWEHAQLAAAEAPMPISSQINPRHTFDTFVVGANNRMAHAVALAVTEQPGARFNPMFVYGGVGLGKTHLLHAIANQMIQCGRRALYCTSEEFTNELIGAIRTQSTDRFRNKFRHTDVLLIDDIQFIGGKESTQEEFFHTFNHLHAAGKQIVLSGDRPPKGLATLEERLRSRFEGGILADVQAPDFETRVAILQAKADTLAQRVPLDVLMLVAERIDSNIRELEGTLNQLLLQGQLQQVPPTVSLANRVLNNLAPRRTPGAPLQVVALVAAHFGLEVDELLGRRRTAPIAHARQVAMYLLRDENGLSLPAIGDYLGGRDHTTVRHGVEKIITDLERDETLRRDVTILREKVYTR